jgi:hypothetical protein
MVRVLDTTLCVISLSVTWGRSVVSSTKTDRHDITEILLKVALSTIKPNQIKDLFAK